MRILIIALMWVIALNTSFNNIAMKDCLHIDGSRAHPTGIRQEHEGYWSYGAVLVSKVNNLGVNQC